MRVMVEGQRGNGREIIGDGRRSFGLAGEKASIQDKT